MKMKIYNPEALRQGAIASITFAHKGGISFNLEAIKLIYGSEDPPKKLGMILCQDEENPKDWFVRICESGGFPLSHHTGKSNCWRFYNSKMSRIFFEACKPVAYDKKTMRVQIKPNPIEIENTNWFLILTKPL